MFNSKIKQRNDLKKIRSNIPKDERTSKSKKITEKLLSSEEYITAKCVMIYISIGSEVQTNDLMLEVLNSGKVLVVPRCKIDDSTMLGYEIKSFDDLSLGSYNIPEPDLVKIKLGEIRQTHRKEIDLVIVPGLGFDKFGYRMGYGKGYYDRFLKDYSGKTIGLSYKECLLDHIYHDEYDIKLNKIIAD